MVISLIFIYLFSILFIFWKKYNNKLFTFLIIFMTSGYVYLSSILVLLYLIYLNFFKNKPDLNHILKIFISSLIIIGLSILKHVYGININEILQLIVFFSLFILLHNSFSNGEYLLTICRGLFIGSIILAVNIIFRGFILNNLSQETFSFFSISSTYNYTGYYLFFGLIFSPYILFKELIYRVVFFLFFAISLFYIQSRSGFVLGTLLFIYLLLNRKRLLQFSFLLILLSISSYYVFQSKLFDRTNSNDIVYSVTDFENNTSNKERLNMLTESISFLTENSTGVGPGNTAVILERKGFNHPHSHNMLANWIYEFGYFGGFIFFIFLVFLFKIVFRKRKNYNLMKLSISIATYILIMTQISALQFNILVSLITYLAFAMLVSLNSNNIGHA